MRLFGNQEHRIAYFVDSTGTMPGRNFLNSIPEKLASRFFDVLDSVAKAPPHKFAGGGYWERMHGDLSDLHEVRIDDKAHRLHHRLFCIVDQEGDEPLLTVLCGASKRVGTKLRTADYERVATVRDEYLAGEPRSIA